MNDVEIIEGLKRSVPVPPDPPANRVDAIHRRARGHRERRWAEAIGSAALAVAVVGGVVVAGGPPAATGSRLDGADVLSVAASRAADAGSVRIRIRVEVSGAPRTEVTGEVDFDRNLGAVRGPGFELRFAAEGVYLRRGTTWYEVPGGTALTRRIGAGDPRDVLAALRRRGRVERVGTERIDGVAMTRYRMHGGGHGPFDASPEVWVDADDLPRRIVLRIDGGAAVRGGGPSLGLVVTTDLYDYGVPVDVTPPPADAVRPLPKGDDGTARFDTGRPSGTFTGPLVELPAG